MRRQSLEAIDRIAVATNLKLYVEQRGRPTLQPASPDQYAEVENLRRQGYLRVVMGPNRRARRAAARQRGQGAA